MEELFPFDDPSLHNQKELVPLDPDELKSAKEDVEYGWKQIVFQIACFIVTLGPIRATVGILAIILAGAFINIERWIVIHVLHPWFGLSEDLGRGIALKVAHVGFKVFLFGIGITHIKKKGKEDSEARFFVANHSNLIDPFLFLTHRGITPVSKKSVQSVKFFNLILDCVDTIYVERSASNGASKVIVDAANDKSKYPILIFPEGTICNGHIMLKFHRSAFLTKHKVQPIAIRYHTPMLPHGYNTYGYTQKSILKWLWNMVSIPFSYVVIEFLEPITPKEISPEETEDVESYAKRAQLILANHLGLKAVENSSHSFFRAKKDE